MLKSALFVRNSVFKAAIFDMDGLLIDSERIIMQACIQAAGEVGINYTQAEYVELIGRAAPDSTRVMTQQLGGTENFSKVMQGLDVILAKRNNAFPLRPGALALLNHYKTQNIICGVASSSYQPIIQHRLSQVGVLDYFNAITSGDEVPRGKPDPDIYLLAIEKLGIPAKYCIAFEDSELGAQAAIAAGLKVVVVPDLKQPSEFVIKNSFKVVSSLIECLG